MWEDELGAMRVRIRTMRSSLVDKLKAKGTATDFSFIIKQRGRFLHRPDSKPGCSHERRIRDLCGWYRSHLPGRIKHKESRLRSGRYCCRSLRTLTETQTPALSRRLRCISFFYFTCTVGVFSGPLIVTGTRIWFHALFICNSILPLILRSLPTSTAPIACIKA